MIFFYQPIVKWGARRALIGRNRSRSTSHQGRFTDVEVNRYVEEAWHRYKELLPNRPTEPTVGSRMNVQLAMLTISFFQVLLEAGIERAYAIELVSDMTWNVYQQRSRLMQFLWRVLPKSLAKPVQKQTDLKRRVQKDGTFSLTFPFNPPGYIANYVPTKGAMGFDIIRCPVAQVFRTHDAVDLCRATWCDLDYGIGEMWGFKLQRTKTLVEGANCCDFRFIYASQETQASKNSNKQAEEKTQRGVNAKIESL